MVAAFFLRQGIKMDRVINYYGAIPQETDLLKTNQNAMVAFAYMAQAFLGTATAVDGFTCTPTTPSSLNVLVTPGQIYQIEDLEQTVVSSLPADTAHTILKQGIMLDAQTFGITPPATFGYSQVFLVQAEYEDLDSGSTVLSYYNSSNPNQPYSGPANNGQAQFTVRKGAVALEVKAGVAATSGTQVTPAPDPGFVGLFTITVANGATSITSGNIATYSSAPFIPCKLPDIPSDVQVGKWVWGGTDTGTANAVVCTLNPVPTQLIPGMAIRFKKSANANTGATTLNVGLGANALIRNNGAAVQAGDLPASCVCEVTWDGSNWQLTNFQGISAGTTNNNTYTLSIPYAVDSSGAANQITAAFTPAITSLSAGETVEVKVANTNTGPTTITVNALGAVNVITRSGAKLGAGSIRAGGVYILVFDGVSFQVVPTTTQVLTQPLTLYVRPSGSDLNDGSANDDAHAFATIQGALNYVGNHYSLNGQTLTIQLGVAGTYTGFVVIDGLPGQIIIQGSTAAQGSYVISGSPSISNQVLVGVIGTSVILRGVELFNASGQYTSLQSASGANVTIDYVTFNGVTGDSTCADITCSGGGSCTATHAVSFLHSASSAIVSQTNGVYFSSTALPVTYTFGVVAYSTAFVDVTQGGAVTIGSGYVTFVNYGSVSGSKYTGSLSGTINTGGGGINFLPGNSAGSLSTGAQIA